MLPSTQLTSRVAAGMSRPTLGAYLHAELNPSTSLPTTDAFWGQTERQRVYNAILYVPYQLERLLAFGLLICADSFLVGSLDCPRHAFCNTWPINSFSCRQCSQSCHSGLWLAPSGSWQLA